MDYALWNDEPMGPSVGSQNTQPQYGNNELQVPHQQNPVQQTVMENRQPQQMPLGNGTPAVSAPPMAMEQTRKTEEGMSNYVLPAVAVGAGVTAYAVTQPSLQNIGYFGETTDIWYILAAVLIVDVIVMFITRYYPHIMGSALNRWYSTFGLNAVLADVLIIVLVLLLARYIYTNYIEPGLADSSWSPWIFVGLAVGLGIFHDFAFYKLVIQNLTRGTNSIIDLFKDYAESGGFNIVFGDALMVGGSTVLAMVLKGQPAHVTGFLGVLAAYCVPYILHTRPMTE